MYWRLTNIHKKKIILAMKDKGDKVMFGGGIYGLAFIGAAVYYIQHATSFLTGLIGVLKALFWPAVLMFKVLELLKM
jgi:hypothetical protein